MMATLYISIILLCRVVQAIFNKRSSNEIKNLTMLVGYSSFKNAVSAILGLILIILAGNGFRVDWLTVLISFFSGITLFFAGFCSIYAMKSGTVSLSSMFGTAGLLVPLVAGVFLFDSPIKPMQWLGVLMFFVAAWFLIGSSKKIYTNFSFKTLVLLVGAMLANGGTMLAQQMFTAYVPDGDVSVFTFLSFGIIAVLGGITFLFMNKDVHEKSEESQSEKFPKILIICGVVLAAAVFVINQLATLSTVLVSPVVLFTFINGGGTIISTVVAAIIYKEKLSKRSVAGVLLGIISLVVIKMF